jgi:hypothetical protein
MILSTEFDPPVLSPPPNGSTFFGRQLTLPAIFLAPSRRQSRASPHSGKRKEASPTRFTTRASERKSGEEVLA